MKNLCLFFFYLNRKSCNVLPGECYRLCFRALKGRIQWIFLKSRRDRFEFIINATSLSLNSKLPAIADGLYKDARVYDLMYGSSSSTVFTEHAVKCGAEEAMDGLGMLVGQAAVSFEIWRGVTPEPQPVLDALRQQL